MSTIFRDTHCAARLPSSAARQHGVTILAAIFMLLLLAALAALMMTLTTSQNETVTQDLQGARAYQAASAGLEWGVFQVMNPENTTPPQSPYACPAPTAISTLAGALSGFTVTVSCSMATNTENTNTLRTYTITANAVTTGAAVGSVGYVERELTATVVTCRQGTASNAATC